MPVRHLAPQVLPSNPMCRLEGENLTNPGALTTHSLVVALVVKSVSIVASEASTMPAGPLELS